MSGYIGAIPTPQATQSRDVYTATSNQTTFTTQGYTPGFVSVYLNGVHLARADFTATNGSDVVLASGATADDTVEIVSFGTFQSADALPLTGGTVTGTVNFPDGSISISDLDIDGGTDIGADIVDADLIIVDDGAGGTNRKATMSRLATYMGTKGLGSTFTTAANGSAPSSPAVGDFWYNTTYGQLLIYMSKDGSNNFWYSFAEGFDGLANDALMNSPGLGYAVIVNTSTKKATGLVSLAVPGESSVFWHTNAMTLHTGNGFAGSLSNAIRGIIIGGYNEQVDISFFTLAFNSETSADFGDLSASIGTMHMTGIDHATRGVFSGARISRDSATTTTNIMEYITIGSAGNATDFGNLVSAKGTFAGAESETRGIFAGGMLDSDGSVTNEMDYITIGSTGNATDFGNLSVARGAAEGVSSTTRSVFCGGGTASVGGLTESTSGTEVNVMDYVTTGTTGNATDFGDLITAANLFNTASSGVAGITTSGIFTIATTANATAIVDLDIDRSTAEVLGGWIPATG